MIHHYITQYLSDDGEHIAEAWIQIDLFGKCFCISKRKIKIHAIGDRQA